MPAAPNKMARNGGSGSDDGGSSSSSSSNATISSTSSSTGATQHHLLAGSIAGCTEVFITMPFETTKTRMQFESKLVAVNPAAVRPFGMMCTIQHIVKAEGVRGLYFGLPVCLVQSSVKNALRFTLFEQFKSWMRKSPATA